MELFSLTTLFRVLSGLYELLFISFISIIIAIFGGLIMGRCMLVRGILGILCKIFLESVRIIPLIAWLFIVYYGISASFDLHISSSVCAIIVFSLWGVAEMGDLTRSGILNVPKHQRNSALALGFNALQIELFIIFPQALIHILPSMVNLFGRIIKTTSLLPLIGVVEILKVGQQLIEVFSKSDAHISFIIYGSILIIYFLLCYPFALLANFLDKKLRVFV